MIQNAWKFSANFANIAAQIYCHAIVQTTNRKDNVMFFSPNPKKMWDGCYAVTRGFDVVGPLRKDGGKVGQFGYVQGYLCQTTGRQYIWGSNIGCDELLRVFGTKQQAIEYSKNPTSFDLKKFLLGLFGFILVIVILKSCC